MKRIIFSILAIVIMCVPILNSCSGGIDTDGAKSYIDDFFDTVSRGDFEDAEGYLHPDRYTDLDEFFNAIESNRNVNFQDGIVINRYTGFSSSYYDSSVDGARYEPTISTTVGDNTVMFTIEIVENDNGYGIYNLQIEVIDQ